jgi:hypothetical protein
MEFIQVLSKCDGVNRRERVNAAGHPAGGVYYWFRQNPTVPETAAA